MLQRIREGYLHSSVAPQLRSTRYRVLFEPRDRGSGERPSSSAHRHHISRSCFRPQRHPDDEEKDVPVMTVQRYMQPVAVHRSHLERLLLTDDTDGWFLWMGDHDADPVEIPQELAFYLLDREELQLLELHQRMWFVVADLPVREPVLPDVAERGFLR
jgi:hypothetical protein